MESEKVERETFKQWLEQNAERLSTYSTDEVANLALACGFSESVVTPWKTTITFRGARS